VLQRGHRPGKLAKQLIRAVGDSDIALAGAETRPRVLKSLEDVEVEELRASSRANTRSVEELIAELRTDMDSRAERRERRLEMIKDKIEQGRLWRGIGVQERIPQMHVNGTGRAVILILLASLDFYVFAQAYAVVADVGGYGVQWWLGGLLGLAVFVACVALAHAIKGTILARAQRDMLAEADNDKVKIDKKMRERLVESRASVLALLLTATIFLSLSVAGVLVRVGGSSSTDSLPVVFFQALIPLVSVVVELYLHDPTERHEPALTIIDRRLERRLAKAEKRLRAMGQHLESRVSKVERLYKVEAAILDVEQKDMGLRNSSDVILIDGHAPTVPLSLNGHANGSGPEKSIQVATRR
jgi:hypothetical protein